MTGMRGFFSGKQKPGDGGAPGGLEAPRPAGDAPRRGGRSSAA